MYLSPSEYLILQVHSFVQELINTTRLDRTSTPVIKAANFFIILRSYLIHSKVLMSLHLKRLSGFSHFLQQKFYEKVNVKQNAKKRYIYMGNTSLFEKNIKRRGGILD